MALTRRPAVGSLFSFVLLLCSFSLLPQFALAQGNPRNLQIGIDPRSNLTGETEESRQKILEGIHSLGATWVRDGFAKSPNGVSDLVDVVRRAKQLNLRFIVQIVQVDGDYDVPLQPNRCGWHAKPLGQIDLTKYTNRLRAQLDALKAANLAVDAFEIGNEDDTDCYNADIPTGRTAAAQDLKAAARGYGKFLMASAEVIHDPKYYPQAKLITFGMAHGGTPSNSLPEPAQFVAMLRNVDGVNYLDNDKYHVDGIGTHIYASPSDVTGSVTKTLEADVAALGTSKPFWLTEWGFLNDKSFPTKKGESLSQAISEYLAAVDSVHRRIPLGPICFYSYSVWLVDESGNPMPQAEVLAKRARADAR